MKTLLKLMGGILITAGASSSLIACNNGTSATKDISSGVAVEDLHTAADPTSTYSQLNWFTGITDIVDSAIQNVFGVSVRDGIDFILTNDQNQAAFEAAGTLVTFTVTAIDTFLSSSNNLKDDDDTNPGLIGKFTFTDTLSAANISFGVSVADQSIPYTAHYTYYSLYSNTQLQNAVVTAIKNSKNTTVAAGTDFKLTSANESSAEVTKGQKIMIMVVANSNKIKGAFAFNVLIS